MFKQAARLFAVLTTALILSLLVVTPALAADMRSGDRVSVPAGDVINDDLYLAGQDVVMDGTVNGDLVAAGGKVTINGSVTGSITVAGQEVTIKGRVGNSVRAAGSTVTVDGAISGDLVVFGSMVTVSSKSTVGRDIYTGCGVLTLDGPLARNLKGSAGKLIINNSIGGNVDVEAGQLTLLPAGNIKGSLKYTSESEATLEPGAAVVGETKYIVPEKKDTGFGCQPAPKTGDGKVTDGDKAAAATIGAAIGAALSAFFGFMLMLLVIGVVLRYIMALATGIVLILLLHKHIPAMVEAIKAKPWPCLGYGALKFFIGPFFIFILLATIVGIPLGLTALALYLILIYLAPILFSIFLGKWMLKQPADVDRTGSLIGALALGLLVLQVACLVPFAGALVWLGAILFGLGMVVLFVRQKMNL